MKKTVKIIAIALAVVMLVGTSLFLLSAADAECVYPELVITEIGTDQYGESANANNTNPNYRGENADLDPYEFIEVYNNADKAVNIFDYMLAYQGCDKADADRFEKSVSMYTPIYPGCDWTDGPFTSYDSFRSDTDARPVNPEYDGGAIASGEVAVIWVYSNDSHTVNASLDQFRAFWKIDESTKVFVIDGGSASETNFSLKNDGMGTYSIIHQSERFSKRRSADVTFGVEYDNTHHGYAGENYETLDEVISWAVIDYSDAPIGTEPADNFTVSYVPYSDSAKAENGYSADSFASLKRMHLDRVNSYEESTVGRLNDEQKAAFAGAKTDTVRAKADPPVVIDEIKDRPSLIITEIGVDQYMEVEQNTNPNAKGNSDTYEFIEIYNNSDGDINIYDYMIGCINVGAGSVSTYFERLIEDYTPIYPGHDWIDAPYTAYDEYLNGAALPANPEYEYGVIGAGEVAVLWAYSKDAFKAQATVEQFRTFWSVPDDVKVFMFDANTEYGEKNFCLENLDCHTYSIIQPCDKYPARRSGDVTFETSGGDRLSVYYNLGENWSYETAPEVISWAVVCYKGYDPLYTYSKGDTKKNHRTNYTLEYSPYNGEEVFTNGFFTVSIPSQKRMHLTGVTTEATVGTLTDAQKESIRNALPE